MKGEGGFPLSPPEAGAFVIRSAAGGKDLFSGRCEGPPPHMGERGRGGDVARGERTVTPVAPPPHHPFPTARSPSGLSLAASAPQHRREPCTGSRAARLWCGRQRSPCSSRRAAAAPLQPRPPSSPTPPAPCRGSAPRRRPQPR